jgi:ABC-type polysaccharide/polyol phosphate transport system ATPase subunit
MCNRAIWLDDGEIKAEDESGEVVKEYLRCLKRSSPVETGLPKLSR